MLDKAQERTAVVIVYQHRLFRDILSGVLSKTKGITVVETARKRENGLRLIEDLNARRIVVIVEAKAQIDLENGTLAYFLRMMQDDARVHVMAVTLGGSGVSIHRWRWLNQLDSDCLVREVLSES